MGPLLTISPPDTTENMCGLVHFCRGRQAEYGVDFRPNVDEVNGINDSDQIGGAEASFDNGGLARHMVKSGKRETIGCRSET